MSENRILFRMKSKTRILFVCLGNICRSPTAEAIFRKKISVDDFVFDSAGTAGYHIGERSDHRSIKHAEKRGYEMKHLARQFSRRDFSDFDLILTMDQSNYRNVLDLAQTDVEKKKVQPVTQFLGSSDFDHIPDPYHGGAQDFELVIDLLERCAKGFKTKNQNGTSEIKLVEFAPNLAKHFKEINKEWISKMFKLETKDEKVLDSPQEIIINPGGEIIFAEIAGRGIVGTCALLKTGPAEFELTKMGVLEAARGTGAGRFLLEAIIDRAKARGAKRLYLLSNRKCESAIHLYEAFGFRHDPAIMKEFGGEYSRCDVAMSFEGL